VCFILPDSLIIANHCALFLMLGINICNGSRFNTSKLGYLFVISVVSVSAASRAIQVISLNILVVALL